MQILSKNFDAISGKYAGDDRWISREDFQALKDRTAEG